MSDVLRESYRLFRFASVGCLVCIAGVTVLILGMKVPATMIEPGIESFKGEERKIADAFYSYEMWHKFSEGPEAYILTGAHVTEVHGCPGAPPYDRQSMLIYKTEISGTIQVHAIFGIPYRKIEAKCSVTG